MFKYLFSSGQDAEQTPGTSAPGPDAKTTSDGADHTQNKRKKKKKKKKKRAKSGADTELPDSDSTGEHNTIEDPDPSESEDTPGKFQHVSGVKRSLSPPGGLRTDTENSAPVNTGTETNPVSQVSIPQHRRGQHRDDLQNETSQPTTERNILQSKVDEHSSQQEMGDATIPTGPTDGTSDGTAEPLQESGVITRQMAKAQDNINSGGNKMTYLEAAKQNGVCIFFILKVEVYLKSS